MGIDEKAALWLKMKDTSLEDLHFNQWYLFDPKSPVPLGLRINKLRDFITRGRIAHNMLKGPFGGGTRLYAQQWFRYAAHSVAIRPTEAGLFTRAINGSINAEGIWDVCNEYLGYNAQGGEIRYSPFFAFIDLEIIVNKWPTSNRSFVLQGIIICKSINPKLLSTEPELESLVFNLLSKGKSKDVSPGLAELVEECEKKLS